MRISKASLAQAAAIAAWINTHAADGDGSREDSGRLDADETNMLAQSLEQMRTRVYEALYPDLKARAMLPIASDIDPGAESFAYEATDWVGEFRPLSADGYGDDPASTETSATKITHNVQDYGGGYTYTLRDMRRAAFSGRPLESRKAVACRRAWEHKLDSVAAFGDASSGIPTGFLNRAVGTTSTTTRETAVTAADWDIASPVADAMLADLNQMVREFIADSKETLEPTDLALPLTQYMIAQHTYFTDVAGGTVMERFKRDNGFIRSVHSWNLLKNADGAGTSNRGVMWRRDPDCMELVIPQEFTVMAPVPHNFAFKVLAMGRTAGFCLYRPLAMRYMTGLPHE